MIKINKKFKKFNLELFFWVFLSFLFLGVGSQTALASYYYDSIEIDIKINPDSTFEVIEKQIYNLDGSFGYFYRDIALKGLDHVSDIEVFNSEGRKLDENEYKISYKNNKENIRWDFIRRVFSDELKSWVIKYKVHGGVGFYENWDEIYWNAIFEDRDVVVKKAEVLVHLPQEFEKEKITQKLFIGRLGSKIESNNYEVVDKQTIRFWGYNIEPDNFLTIVASWPKGAVRKPFLYREQIINWIVLLVALVLPIFTFVRMFNLWKKEGKDPKIKKTIIAHYSPPGNLPPALFGVLMDQNVDMKDILATVVDLAVRGYLRIIERVGGFGFFKTKEYIFERLKNVNDLKPFEKQIMEGIFLGRSTVSSRDLKNKFYREIPDIQKSLYQEVAQTGYFKGNIKHIRDRYRKTSYIILILSFVIFFSLIVLSSSLWPGLMRYFFQIFMFEVSLVMTAIIIMVFAHFMPVLTEQGLEAKWKLLGFKEYLRVAEKFRIEAETLETFSKFLPFAMILGVEKKWANRFADFSYQKQDWYLPAGYISGGIPKGGAPISIGSFSSSFSSFASSITSTFSGPSGGAGAGGAGGAGGGGGGGGGGAG